MRKEREFERRQRDLSAAETGVNNIEAKVVARVEVQSSNNAEERVQSRRLQDGISCEEMFKKEPKALNAMTARLKAAGEKHARHVTKKQCDQLKKR